ncbi:MAG TPA: hypothetical protein VFW62_03680, partial [bacterium]|nr:hypothetical protein [bacterium]
ASTQIKGFVFRGVSTHREKALLEVDITLSNGNLIQGAQIALTRQEGMRYLSRRPGEEIVADQLVKGTFLTIARPKVEAHGPEAASVSAVAPEPASTAPVPALSRLNWAYYLGMGAMLFAVLLLIYLFTL